MTIDGSQAWIVSGVRDVGDLYTVTEEQLLGLEGFAEVSARKLLDGIDARVDGHPNSRRRPDRHGAWARPDHEHGS